MNFTNDMMLMSESGYSMPFNGKSEDVVLLKGYGPQEDGTFNHGLDFLAGKYVLKSVADGVVASLSASQEHGMCQTIRHGGYEVAYGGISNALAPFGMKVKAGVPVAISGKTLHLEVRYQGSEADPMEFLTMLFGNVKMREANPGGGAPDLATLDMDIPTEYDEWKEEIEELMLRHYPEYLMEAASGLYRVPARTEQSLRNIFSVSSARKHFYERIPSLSNPLGLGERSIPAAAKAQSLLIGDFLNYLALRHQIFLSGLGSDIKKKDTPRL